MMTWIKFLVTNQIKYYIYKIKKQDSTVIKGIDTNQIIIILFGASYITETFLNKETSTLALLKRNSIFIFDQLNREIYYKIIPLETTYILNIKQNIFINKKLNKLIYKNTFNKHIAESYKIINIIIKQKNTTNRIIQLILIFCLHYGHIKGKSIYIPFQLSYKNIATLTGTSENTVTKIMNKIYKNNIIKKIDKKIISLNNINTLKFK